MKSTLILSLVLAIGIGAGAAQAKPSAAIVAAVADPARPEADTKRDADRLPAQMLEFAGIKPGQTVADFLPGGGYFTRIFAKAVGPKGTVYAVINPPAPDAKRANPIIAVAEEPAYTNIKIVQGDFATLALPTSADVIWTSQNYHDVHAFGAPGSADAINRAVFAALKPGGIYLVVDHAAQAGSGVRDVKTLHRIDIEVVKREVLAAGFVLDGETPALANPADTHTLLVFDTAIRGHTDQFALRFKKPS